MSDAVTATTGVLRLGRTVYRECAALQRQMVDLRIRGVSTDLLLLTEHEHVYTMGTGSDENHLLASEPELRRLKAVVERSERGGDVTYHGPGQLVVYPIIDLQQRTPDLHRYLRDLEEVVVRALREFGVEGGRVEGYSGVWVGEEKICAMGIHVRRWVTMHGFALNVSTDLSYFGRIIPCGIFERGVTSLQEILGREVEPAAVEAAIIRSWATVFQTAVHERALSDVLRQTVSGGSTTP
jgi:lipoyl(octanoyl) transferase